MISSFIIRFIKLATKKTKKNFAKKTHKCQIIAFNSPSNEENNIYSGKYSFRWIERKSKVQKLSLRNFFFSNYQKFSPMINWLWGIQFRRSEIALNDIIWNYSILSFSLCRLKMTAHSIRFFYFSVYYFCKMTTTYCVDEKYSCRCPWATIAKTPPISE